MTGAGPAPEGRIRGALLRIFVVFAAAVLLVAGSAVLGLELLSSIRGYVGGESLWSKSQKEAVAALGDYARTGAPGHWERYLEALRVPVGDRQARVELEKEDPDLERVRRALRQGGLDPDDIGGMIRLYRWFGDVGPMREAAALWARGDSLMAEVHTEAARIRRARAGTSPDRTAVDGSLDRLARLDAELTAVETRFMRTISGAARRVHRWSAGAIGVLTLVLLVGGGVVHRFVYRGIRERDAALRRAERRYRRIFEDSRDVIYVTDRDGTIVDMNPAGRAMFGYSREELSKLRAKNLYRDPADRRRFQEQIDRKGEAEEFEVKLETRDGQVLDCLITSTARYVDGEVVGYQGIIRDITEQKEFERELEYRALHDPLTELPNRALFWDRLEHALSRSRRRGTGLAVLFVDLDGFKKINDSLGHGAGDRVLVEVADRLRGALRDVDTAARLGGDEFGVLLERVETREDVEEAAARIRAAFEAPFSVPEETFHVSASIGIFLVEDPGAQGPALDPDELVRRADAAMYRAKEEAGVTYRFHAADADRGRAGRLERETRLREALEADQFELDYQPIVDLGSGRIVAVEPLVRWRHPDRGRLPPAEFLPLAAETGLIRPLGRRVLAASLRQLAGWNEGRSPGEEIRLHPNVSASEVETGEFVGRLEELLEATGVVPGWVQLEITEQVAMSTATRLRRLRGLGVGLAIDDFGTGYASFTYVQQLDVDALKIDRSFVRGLGRARTDEAIARTILTLGRELGVEVIAEGVETEGQRDWLVAENCRLAQGYLLGRPMPADRLEARLSGEGEAG